MKIVVEHYNADCVPNPNPHGATSYKTFNKVRQAILAACRKHGVTYPDDDPYPDANPFECDMFLVDDQYNDDLYHYMEICNRKVLSPAWFQDMMEVLRHFPNWGIGIKNIRFAYLIVFSDKLMVTGHPMSGCNDIKSVVAAASANLWGVNGEVDPYIAEQFHREELLESPICGCYYCCAIFPPSQIIQWTDEDDDGSGQTAVCPQCGQSKIIAPKPSFTLEPESLRQLSELAFGPVAKRFT